MYTYDKRMAESFQGVNLSSKRIQSRKAKHIATHGKKGEIKIAHVNVDDTAAVCLSVCFLFNLLRAGQLLLLHV